MIVLINKASVKDAVKKYTDLGYEEDRILVGSSFKKIESVIEKAKDDYDVIALHFKYSKEDFEKLEKAFGIVYFK